MVFEFTLENKRNLINLLGRKPKFYNDISNDFLHCKTIKLFISKLINEIILRNFKILDWNIHFYLSDDNIFLDYIESKDFKLQFENNFISKIYILKKKLFIYDNNHLLYQIYNGCNWENDRNDFYNQKKYNLKYNILEYNSSEYERCNEIEEKQYKMFLRKLKLYQINEDKNYINFLYKSNNKYLISHSNKNNSLKYYYTEQIIFEMFNWIYRNIYNVIKEQPIPKKLDIKDIFIEPKKIKYNLKSFYLVVNHNYEFCDMNVLGEYPIKKMNYLKPNNRTLSRLYMNDDDFINTKYGYLITNDAPFIEASFVKIGEKPVQTHDKYPQYIKLNLNYYNDVFVYNPEDKNVFNTIIPIIEYKFNYKKAVILINRILKKDEFKILDY